jgi:hypothetical protein
MIYRTFFFRVRADQRILGAAGASLLTGTAKPLRKLLWVMISLHGNTLCPATCNLCVTASAAETATAAPE